MIAWEIIDPPTGVGPDGDLSLHRRGDEWSIRSGGVELMNSRRFESERRLAESAAALLDRAWTEHVLIGGLGMGHSLRAALDAFPKAEIVVAEISPRVIAWNRGPLGALAGAPLDAPRCRVLEADVRDAIAAARRRPADDRYTAILLDVDNGPEALSQPGNAALYSASGLSVIRQALSPGGVVAFWSAGPSPPFERRLRQAGFELRTERAPVRAGGRGRARHTIWLAQPRSRGNRA